MQATLCLLDTSELVPGATKRAELMSIKKIGVLNFIPAYF